MIYKEKKIGTVDCPEMSWFWSKLGIATGSICVNKGNNVATVTLQQILVYLMIIYSHVPFFTEKITAL